MAIHVIPTLMHVGGTEINLVRSVHSDDIIIVIYGNYISRKFHEYLIGRKIVLLNSKSLLHALYLMRVAIMAVDGRVLQIHCWLSPSIVITHLSLLWFTEKKFNFFWQIRSLPTWHKLSRVLSNFLLGALSLFIRPKLIFNSYASKSKYWFLRFSATEVSWNVLDPSKLKFNEHLISGIRSTLSIPPDAVVFLCVGRNVIEKNYKRFLSAVIDASRSWNLGSAVVIFVGRDCSSLSLREGVYVNERLTIHLIEHVDDVSPYYGISDIICVPSISESCSNALLEGLHFGLYPLISKAGDNELIANTKGFDPYNIKEITSFVAKAYIDVV